MKKTFGLSYIEYLILFLMQFVICDLFFYETKNVHHLEIWLVRFIQACNASFSDIMMWWCLSLSSARVLQVKVTTLDAYLEHKQACKMELFTKNLNGFQSLTIFARSSISDV